MTGLLNGAESQHFAAVLFDAYTPARLSALLLSLDRPPVDRQAPMNATFEEATLEIVLNANREGWAPNLLKAVAADVPGNGRVQQFFTSHAHLDPAKNPYVANPWMTYRLFGGQLFLGRVRGRKLLMRMNDPVSRKVLIVTSDRRQVGKTHTRTLINFVSQQDPQNHVSYVDLDAQTYDLRTLVSELCAKWGIDSGSLPKQGEEQEPRWAQQLAPYLVENAPSKNRLVRWLILDGFREKVPSAGIQAFIDELAVNIQSTVSFRLILVNYTFPLPISLLTFEDVVLPLTPSEIQTAFTAVHKTCYGNDPSPNDMQMYMDAYTARLQKYKQRAQEHAESHLLIHNAAADVIEEM